MKRICRRNGVAASSLLFAGLVLPGLVVPLAAEQSNSLSITVDSDPLDQKIMACARSLASMATANEFVDSGACR